MLLSFMLVLNSTVKFMKISLYDILLHHNILLRKEKLRLYHAEDEGYYVLCYEYSQVVNTTYGLRPIPDVLLNLCLGIQIERISSQKSDPLLLSLGSILLLLCQHFGETL